MTNTLYLPELREMLAEGNAVELHEFCVALHPARTAEFMEGLTAAEAWRVLQHTDPASQVEIFRYFELPRQVEMFETVALEEMAKFISGLPADERVDILSEVQPEIVQALLPLIPVDERRDIMRLAAYPEGTAGAMMTTRFARLSESETAAQALDHVRRQADLLETIYYLYVVDKDDHLRGLVSLRQLVLTEPESLVRDIMRRDAISVDVTADQELVAQKFAKFDFLALPVVDSEHHLLGIVTHDDAIDVVVEEATEDAQRIGGVNPLSTGYIDTKLFELAWKRGVWLMILFFGALLTAFALKRYEHSIDEVAWLVLFLPLIISSGGNTGSQSATLIITALHRGHHAPGLVARRQTRNRHWFNPRHIPGRDRLRSRHDHRRHDGHWRSESAPRGRDSHHARARGHLRHAVRLDVAAVVSAVGTRSRDHEQSLRVLHLRHRRHRDLHASGDLLAALNA